MAQSFDLNDLSLEQAAELVATRVTLRDKSAADFQMPNIDLSQIVEAFQNLDPTTQAALVGGGLGGGASLLSTAVSGDEDRKKHWMRNALLGSLLGAGVGGAGGYAMSQLPTVAERDPAVEQQLQQQAGEDPTGWGFFGEQLKNLGGKAYEGIFGPAPPSPPPTAGNSPPTAGNSPPTAGNSPPTAGPSMNMNRLPASVEHGLYGAAAGYGGGRMLDNHMATPPKLTGQRLVDRIQRMNDAEFDQLGKLNRPTAKAIQHELQAGGKYKPGYNGPSYQKTTGRVPYKPSWVKRPATVGGATITPQLQTDMNERFRGPAKPAGKLFRWVGPALGFGAGFLADQAFNNR